MPDFAIWQFKKPYCLEVISNCEGPFIYVDSNLLTKETSLFKIWEQIQCLKEFNICNRKAFNLTKIIKYQVFCRYLLKKQGWLINILEKTCCFLNTLRIYLYLNLITLFFINNTFISKLPKNHANAKQYHEAELLQFENYILHRHYHLKIVGDILKISKITSVSVTMRLMITKMKMKLKTKSHR